MESACVKNVEINPRGLLIKAVRQGVLSCALKLVDESIYNLSETIIDGKRHPVIYRYSIIDSGSRITWIRIILRKFVVGRYRRGILQLYIHRLTKEREKIT